MWFIGNLVMQAGGLLFAAMSPILGKFLSFALFALVILASVLVGCGLNGSLVAFFNDFHGHWVRWDAEGYLALASQGYNAQTESYLVLLPLYPTLVRVLSFLLMGNVTLAGFLISNFSLVGAGWALYLLVQETQGQVK